MPKTTKAMAAIQIRETFTAGRRDVMDCAEFKEA
jgi:hypothetical protein